MKSHRRLFLGAGAFASLLVGLKALSAPATGAAPASAPENFPFTHTDAEWRSLLTPQSYDVLRHEGTERPYSSPLNGQHNSGIFACAGCARDLYSSKTKFDSHTGWPSFWQPLDNAVATRRDSTFGMSRTEVHCSNCGGHLGHVFNDGPDPTGLRYCMNGVAMTFRPVAL